MFLINRCLKIKYRHVFQSLNDPKTMIHENKYFENKG